MPLNIRRVVTGHDAAGRAVIVEDATAPAVHADPQRPGFEWVDLWRTPETPVPLQARMTDGIAGDQWLPPTAGTSLLVVELPPAGPGGDAALALHRTETMDYALVLSGEPTLVLDAGEVVLHAGDTVVQCGTSHGWVNRSDTPARIAFTLVDGAFDAGLQARQGAAVSHVAPGAVASGVRRVVTGHDQQGRSVVIADGDPPLVHTDPRRPGYSSVDIWRTNAAPAPIAAAAADPTPGPRRQMPNPGGTVTRINTIMPDTAELLGLDPSKAREVFATMGNAAASTFADNLRHPMMHRTQTLDYAIMLEGELTMVMDDVDVVLHAGDVVIQCGTNHAWANRSAAPARIAFVLIDGRFDETLAALPAGH